ncbi:MAG: tyrosine-type recombinase/integrase [Bacteroidota bacterium]
MPTDASSTPTSLTSPSVSPVPSPTWTISQAVNAFIETLPKKNNYERVVRKFLIFTVGHQLLLNDFSRDQYFSQYAQQHTLGYNITSPIRKFLRFAQQHNIYQVAADPEEQRLPPAANKLILGYISEAKNLRGRGSKKTYINSLNTFFAWLDQQQKPFFFSSVSAYIDHLIDQNKSPFTINLYLSVIKQLAKWVVQARNRLPIDVSADQLESLRDIQYIRGLVYERTYYKESLSEPQREQLRAAIDDPLWRSVISLMSYSGLRTVEIPRLRLGDIDLERKTINVKGKGKHNYELVKLIGASVNDMTIYYQQHINPTQKKTAPLFPTLRTAKQVQDQTRKYLHLAGLSEEGLSPHSLRHTAAQILVDEGVNPVYVQQQLRHATFNVTQVYVRKTLKRKFLSDMEEHQRNRTPNKHG